MDEEAEDSIGHRSMQRRSTLVYALGSDHPMLLKNKPTGTHIA